MHSFKPFCQLALKSSIPPPHPCTVLEQGRFSVLRTIARTAIVTLGTLPLNHASVSEL